MGKTELAVRSLIEPARAVDEAQQRAYEARGRAASAADEYREAQVAFRRALEALARPQLQARNGDGPRVLDVGAAVDAGGYVDDSGRPV
jgi:hypothetical protein